MSEAPSDPGTGEGGPPPRAVDAGFFSSMIGRTAQGRPLPKGTVGLGTAEVLIGIQFSATGAGGGLNGAASIELPGESVIREFGVWVGLETGTILPYELGFAMGTEAVTTLEDFRAQEPLFPFVGSGVLVAQRLWIRGGEPPTVIRGAFPLRTRGRRILMFFTNAHATAVQVAYAWFVCDRFV